MWKPPAVRLELNVAHVRGCGFCHLVRATCEDNAQHVKGGIMDLEEYAAALARIADEMRRNRKAYDELDEQHLRSVRSGGLPTVGTMATLRAEWARLDREYDLIREMHQTLIDRGADL